MQNNTALRVRAHPRFAELVAKRSRLSWTLTIIQLVIYFGFTIIIAVNPGFLKESLSGGTTTMGIPVGIAVIVSAFVLSAVYVWKANGEFDEINSQIIDEVTK
ncbi:MAG: hypothetical protein B7Z60_04105 [Ferrovum sp. 37-45-19]|jgi:uncharacterized membrane protein (DUF485 family)|uniref:DUF485 domain-containing protein n=1 Tax=Ferrovum sp. JA12 TaxID=1356299 RepID=UPI000702C585|nr:DUF485 domain-containing protein [Ferrovum sp. JA12]OYV79584.1 MAG: hypothetical protein B7Z65_05395 [Ferrovum sp. 21-44-67]OYV94621.1 MAG: hypothetical protein B7Z60_04105 [Ferrovum sp. 37-45-19]OZB34553.1 MAG: hypothetical protein B7X47_00700 [Ferrovum sp. 34-44-207]HQT81506.1 DUF485 domain-containing protein [Ferrovaceae bacterium]KRH79478.1 inner membrane protein YjcH [Ferrovum sp. JA12]